MRTKRILALLVALTLTMSVALTACSEKTDSSNGKSSTDSSKDTSSVDGENPKDDEVVTITYAGWEDHLMALEMATKFNERNPNIKVEILNNDEWRGNDYLIQRAATGDMPDIIGMENIVTPMQNKWIIDLKPYIEKDEEASKLPQTFLKNSTFNDKVIMLPAYVYLYGVMLNLDLLAANGIEKPEYSWTVDDFSNIVKKTTKRGSTIGVNEVRPLMHHTPAQMNPKLGMGSFDNETQQYVLGKEWEYAVDTVQDLMDANVSLYEDVDALGKPADFEEGSAEQKDVVASREKFLTEAVGETDPGAIWAKGKAAAWMDFSWSTGFDQQANYGGFEWDFYPLPVAEKGDTTRTHLMVDSMAITTSCKNPEAAYEFAKYLSFSSVGIEDRIEIVKNYDVEALKVKYADIKVSEASYQLPLNFYQMPISNDKAVIAKWAEFNNVKPGISYLVEGFEDAYVDGYKAIPGFNDAYFLTIEKAVLEEVFTGKKAAADLAKELEEKANKITADAYAVMK